jgi:hypothetical protein
MIPSKTKRPCSRLSCGNLRPLRKEKTYY